tara:strand:+ start:3806 stop:4096 length:291 start_codon:yes stop_codon:yes gene_type:complete
MAKTSKTLKISRKTNKQKRIKNKSRRQKKRGGNKAMNEEQIRDIIEQFLTDIDDPDFFTKSEIKKFVEISITKRLTKNQILDGLEQSPKSYGVFEE